MTRVDSLMLRVLNQILRMRFRQEALAITLTGVKCSPDMRQARVGFSVIDDNVASARKFFRQNQKKIFELLLSEVVFKKYPRLVFFYDDSLRSAANVDRILNEVLPQEKKDE